MKLTKLIKIALILSSTQAVADPAATHGMLLFGDKITYASHLPMFHAPHDYQLIIKLALSDLPRSETLKIYQQAKADGAALFSLVPERMDLTTIIDGTRTSFKAQIYQGHFERNGTRLGPIQVQVTQIVKAAKLNADQEPSALEQYLLFGEKGEYFAAHIIKDKPSFDVIAKIHPPVEKQSQPCRVLPCPELPSVPVPDDLLPFTIDSVNPNPGVGEMIGKPSNGIQSVVENIIYFEEDELSH